MQLRALLEARTTTHIQILTAAILIGISSFTASGQSPQTFNIDSGLPRPSPESNTHLEKSPPKVLASVNFVCTPQIFNQQAKLLGSMVDLRSDLFGSPIAISGDRLLIGSPGDDDKANSSTSQGFGLAYTFVFDGSRWKQESVLYPSQRVKGARFGHSLDLQGDTLVIGEPFKPNGPDGTGRVHIFRFDGVQWILDAELFPPSPTTSGFGSSIDLDGTKLAIGSQDSTVRGTAFAGEMHIYELSGQTWGFSSTLTPAVLSVIPGFGAQVSLDGDWIAVSNGIDLFSTSSISGSVYLFNLQGGIWTEQVRFVNPVTKADNRFGVSISLSGNALFIGTNLDIAYSYRFDGVTWTQDPTSYELSGAVTDSLRKTSVDVVGNFAVIGFTSADLNGGSSRSGAVKTYNFDGSNWIEGETLLASDREITFLTTRERFGTGLVTDGLRIAVGSRKSTNRGTAYLFDQQPLPDCNNNGIPDQCDDILDFPDCNNNMIPDVCEIADLSATDCNENGIPDSCDLTIFQSTESDCNNNGILDACEVTGGVTNDCNLNGIPDSCDLDCNFNGLPDDCEVSADPASDTNFNGVPDECECPVQSLAFESQIDTNSSFGRAVDINGDFAIMGAPTYKSGTLFRAGAAFIYHRRGLEWEFLAKLLPSDAGQDDRFGESVAIQGDIAVVGTPSKGQWCVDNGAVYVFRHDSVTGNWNQEAIITQTDPEANCGFGLTVDLEGDFLAISSGVGTAEGQFMGIYMYKFDENAGFENTGAWIQTDRLRGTDFNSAIFLTPTNWIDFNGNLLIVGDALMKPEPTAYIYRFDGTSWNFEQRLTSATGDPDDWFGYGVSIDDNRAIVGTRQANVGVELSVGSAQIFRFDGSNWNLETILTNPDSFGNFGTPVIIRNNTVTVGTGSTRLLDALTFTFSDKGNLHVFNLDETLNEWFLSRSITPFDNVAFGLSSAASGTSLIVGNRQYPDPATGLDTGAAYIISGIFGPDCDANLEPDVCDIFFGRAEDLNNNAIPDSCEILGDTNDDGIVNVADLLTLLTSWGSCPAPCPADFDANGNVSVADLLILLTNWG